MCHTVYIHNQVAKYLYWNIIRDLKINVSELWIKHLQTYVTDKNGVKVLTMGFVYFNRQKGNAKSPRYYYKQ